jgi:hypothetical protein
MITNEQVLPPPIAVPSPVRLHKIWCVIRAIGRALAWSTITITARPACRPATPARASTSPSTVLAGQRLGIKEVDDGIWLVSFMSYDLGFVDLEQKTLQPLDNPFGPRLSPMS